MTSTRHLAVVVAVLALIGCAQAQARPRPNQIVCEPTTTTLETTTTTVPTTVTTVPSTTTTTAPAVPTRWVAPSGSDSAAGSESAPWRTIAKALRWAQPGTRVVIRGGTYTENIKLYDLHPGTSAKPVTVTAAPGERPVLKGVIWLTSPSYWTIQGLNVTWNSANPSSWHMVILWGGTGWRWTGSELWGAHSYAALAVSQGATGFRIDRNYIHDTYQSNDLNQDHLIYVGSNQGGSGVIERNVLAHSPNGRGIKLGPGSLDKPGAYNITIRYNTLVDNRGPSNIQLSGSSSGNTIYRNILVASDSASVTYWELSGTNNRAYDNVWWQATRAVMTGDTGLVDAGGNVHVDPVLDPQYRPTNSAAAGYGHAA